MNGAQAMAPEVFRFAAPQMLWFLLAIPLGLLLSSWGWRARDHARRTWAGDLFARLAPGYDRGRERMKVALFWLGWGFVVLALARPQWGGDIVEVQRRGIDLIVAMDTSSSMMAEDMKPNRLKQAQRAVSELVGQLGGDRVGLLAFAGEAFAVCPLTLDHGTVLLMLESLNMNSVSTPGTNLEAAIRKARSSFVREEHKHKALLLVTDGESHQGDPIAEAEKAAEEGIIIYTIGLGSPDGEPIPERDEGGNVSGYKRDRGGRVVSSKLDEGTLRRIAEVTRGRYFRSTPHALELATVLEDLQGLEKKELEGQLTTNYEERYQWPLVVATILLAWELVVPNRRRRSEVT